MSTTAIEYRTERGEWAGEVTSTQTEFGISYAYRYGRTAQPRARTWEVPVGGWGSVEQATQVLESAMARDIESYEMLVDPIRTASEVSLYYRDVRDSQILDGEYEA